MRAGASRLLLVAAVVAGAVGPRIAPASAAVSKRSQALVQAQLQAGPGEAQLAYVFFRDKGARLEEARAVALGQVSSRALARRARRGLRAAGVAFEDLPLDRQYVEAVADRAHRIRHELRFLNAVSVEATSAQLREIEALPFVERLDSVRRFRRPAEDPIVLVDEARARARTERTTEHALDYGTSLGQLDQIGVPALHDRGLHGEGVVIAVLDAGFDNLAHEAFATMAIAARHDFVNGDDDVGNGADLGEGSHGTNTLSTIGGFKDGQLVGPAFAATFILAKTEDTTKETPVEEDNWAAAAEWAEALGADVISSSLGYRDFDRGIPSYTAADMDGRTAISTRAAEIAAARGVVVVNSAGNEGLDPAQNTLGAPSDAEHVLAAAAVSSTGARVGFSSVGPSADGRIKPDVAAQGQAVKVAVSGAPNGYGRANGTSFSCPLTAGVAALVVQAHPDYDVSQVLQVIRGTSSQASAPDRLLGYGIVNARAAVDAPRP